MRTGMRRVAGTSGKKGGKSEATFGVVFGWVLGIALLIGLIALFTR